MRNDDLALLQELVRHRHAFVQQPAGILAQIEHQPLDVVLAQPLQVSSISWLVFSLNCPHPT